MKQFGIGIAFVAGVAALGAYFVLGSPVSLSAPSQKAATSTAIPRSTGFDFYVLALSWSPTYCQDISARKRDVVQCAGPRPFAFVVHGLWPQFERGYPRSCQTSQRRPSQTLARSMLDIMPSERLVQHEWESHGTCSGLTASEYFSVVRSAFQAIRIPSVYARASDWRRVRAGDVEGAFTEANPGLGLNEIAVSRRGNNLSEVRICLTLDLKPRTCPEVDQDGVGPNTRLTLPPARG
jgi:ribonuclease T2